METSKTFLARAAGRAVFAAFAVAMVAVPAMRAEDGGTSTSTEVKKVDFTLASPVDKMTFAMPDATSGVSSSADAVADERENLAENFDPGQPPPRRRTYGRPHYQDKWHNTDGSTKIAFEVGGGFNAPTGATAHYQTVGYNFSVGGGLNFNKAFGILAQFDWDNMGIPSSILQRVRQDYQTANPGVDFTGFDGSTHLWSFTVNPVINFQGSGHAGAYIVGGLGYYHKTTSFTLPTVTAYCDYYYGCSPYVANQEIDHYTNGAFGLNAGLGLTYKFSNFSNMKLYAEARYVWVNNSQDPNIYYQPNNYRTGYFPVKFGIRY